MSEANPAPSAKKIFSAALSFCKTNEKNFTNVEMRDIT
jgi:hypothetical protein